MLHELSVGGRLWFSWAEEIQIEMSTHGSLVWYFHHRQQRRLWQLGCTKPAVFMVWSVLNVHPSWRIGRRLLNKVTPRTQASTVGKSLGVSLSLSLSFSLCRLLSGSLILELQQSAPACLCQKFQIEKCDKVGATLKIDKHTSLD